MSNSPAFSIDKIISASNGIKRKPRMKKDMIKSLFVITRVEKPGCNTFKK
ncbi:MAG: hypothetical protein P0116_10205 [Candidatus Nitrosocosmicus sp.]|nr:hypothetical protein [Candidatus Nitrosocosmicus sp.]